MFVSFIRRFNPWASLAGLPTLAFWVAFATFINRAGSMVMPFMLLYLNRELGWKAATAASVLFVYGLCSVVSGPISGRLCDRYGCGRVLCCSLGCSAVLLLLFPLVSSFSAVMALTIVLAFASGSFRPASLAIQTEILSVEDRQRGFTLNRLAVNAGMSVGPAVGGFLASLWFPAIFIVDGLSALLATALLMRLVWGLRAPTVTTENAPRSPLADVRYRRFLLGSFLVVLGFLQVEGALALNMVEDLGLSERAFGLLFTVNTIFIVCFEVAINQRTSRWASSNALLLGSLLLGVGLGATAVVGTLTSLVLLTVVWTVGEIILFPAQLVWVSNMAEEGTVGAYMGMLTSSSGLAFALAPVVGVPLYQALGQMHFWPLVLICCFVGGLLMSRS